jgi:Zn-dependent membrane protease YugP
MHPILILVPALGLFLAPRLWVSRIMREHDAEEDQPASAQELARDMLDRHQLHAVKVEVTDLGDHYDPGARAVRLSRHNFDRKSLSAITAAAHEVAHALQHDSGYAPFEWRSRLTHAARIAGEAGSVLIISVPLTHLLNRRPLPPKLLGLTVLGMLGTGAAAQLSALPTEFDASFRRALPMLRDGYIAGDQVDAAHRILFACSLTYVASSLAGVLNIWPWLGRGPIALVAGSDQGRSPETAVAGNPGTRRRAKAKRPSPAAGNSLRGGRFEATLRRFAKPLIRMALTE